MAKKSKFLKNLLTTASAATVLIGGIQTAYGAAARTTVADNFDLTTGGNLNGGGVFVTGSSLTLTGAHDGQAGGVGLAIAGYDLDGNNGRTFNVDENTTIGSVVDLTNTNAKLSVLVDDGKTLTLDGSVLGGFGGAANTYTAFGDIQLGHAAGGGAVLTINMAGGVKVITLNGKINSDADDVGTLNIVAANTVTFNGAIGSGFRLLATNVTGTAIFNNTVKSKGITVANTGNATFNDAVTANVGGIIVSGTALFAGAVTSNTAAVGITLDNAASTVTFKNAVTLADKTIKFTAASADVAKGVFIDGPAAHVNAGAGNNAIDFNDLDSYVTIRNGGKVTGKVLNNTATLVAGKLVFGDGGGTVDGAVGGANNEALTNVDFSNSTNGESLITGTVNATNINVKHANANARVNGLITGDVTYTAAGTLTTGGGITGNVAFGANQGKLVVADNKTITGTITGNGALGAGGAGTVSFQGTGTVTLAVGAGNALANINFDGETANGGAKVEFQNTVNAANLSINHAKAKVQTNAAVAANNIIFNQAGQFTAKENVTSAIQFKSDGTFIIEDGKNITGAISTTVPNAGTLDLQGASVVDGAIGALGFSLKEIKLASGGGNKAINLGNGNTVFAQKITANSDGATTIGGALTVGTAVSGNGLVYTAAGTVNINGGMTGDVNFNNQTNAVLNLANGQNLTGNIVAGGAGKGKLDIKGASTISGTIGANGASILQIDTAAGAVNFQKQVYAQTVNVVNANTNITAAELITGNVVYAADGKVTATGGLKGDVNFANNAGTFTLGAGATLDGAVVSGGASKGTLNFVGGGHIIGAIGNVQELAAINFGGKGEVILGGVTKATTITFNADEVNVDVNNNITATTIDFKGKASTIVVNDGKNIIADIYGDSTNTTVAGTLTFNGDSTVTGEVGKTKGLTAINFKNSNAALKTVGFTDKVTAATITFDGTGAGGTKMKLSTANKELVGNVVFKGASDIAHEVELSDGSKLTGSVDNQGTASLGTVTFKGDSTVSEKIGETKEIKLLSFQGDNTKTVNLEKDVRALTLRYTNDGNVVAKGDVTGNIDFANQDGVFTIADGKSITGKVISGGGSVGTLKFKGDTTLIGDVGTAANKVKLLNFDFAAVNKTVTLVGTVNATTLKFNANAGTVVAQKDVSGDIDFNNLPGVFALPTNGTFTGGVVDGTGGNKGTLRVDGNTTYKGKIGDGNAIDKVLYTGAYSLTVDSNAAAGLINANGGVDFASHAATLRITGNFAQTIDSAMVNANNAAIVLDASIGTNKNVTFTKTIGTAGAALQTFQVGTGVASAAAVIELQEDAYIANAIFGGATNLKLNKNNGQFKIGSVQLVDNVVSLQINADATLVTGTNLTAADGSKLKDLEFSANNTLTIADGVNIAANATTNGAGAGKLKFLGNSTFDTKITNNLAEIDAKNLAIGQTVKFISDVNATNITGGLGTLAFTANVTGAVDANVNGQGTVQFVNTAPLEVDATFGTTKAFSAIKFSGSDVKFKAAVGTNPFVFESANPTTVTLNVATDFSNVVVTNNSAAPTKHVIVLTKGGGNLGFNAAIGSVANPVEVRLDTVTTKAQIAVDTKGAIITTGAGKGTNEVEFTVDGAALKGIGTNTTNLSKVTFTASGSTGDTFADLVQVAGTKTATFKGILSSKDLQLLAAGSTATFTDGATLSSKISAVTGGEGIVNFTGSGTVNQAIGTVGAKLKSVSFSSVNANAVVNLGADVSATTITGDANTTLQLNKNLAFNGTASFSSLALGSNNLTVNNPASVSLTLTKDVQISTTISGKGNAVTGGIIKNTPNSKADVTGLASATITVDDTNLDVPEVSRTFTLLQNDGTYAAPTAFAGATVTGKAALTKWVGSFNPNGSFILTQSNEAVQVLSNDLGTAANEEDKINANILAKSGPNVQELNKITNQEARKEYIERIVATNAEPAITDLTSTVVSDLGNHVFNLAGLQSTPTQERVVSAAGDSGVAAGDDPSRYGVWATPFYNKGRQKSRNNAAGYESTTFGAMFGFDTKVNDNSIFGAAIALLNTKIKFKNFKSGDKTKADTVMFSVYGMQQFTNNIFAQAVVTFGSNSIDTDEKRITGNTTSQKAKGKYDSAAFGFEALAGYNYLADQMVSITPMAGLKYTRVNDDSYKETGTTNQNLSVHKKASNRLDLVGGVRVAGGTFDVVELAVTPEVHGFVNFDVLNKKQKVTLRLDGTNTPLAPKAGKPNRVHFNAGVGLNASYSYMEYGLGYDAYIANKYLAHQGTLKVRVNF